MTHIQMQNDYLWIGNRSYSLKELDQRMEEFVNLAMNKILECDSLNSWSIIDLTDFETDSIEYNQVKKFYKKLAYKLSQHQTIESKGIDCEQFNTEHGSEFFKTLENIAFPNLSDIDGLDPNNIIRILEQNKLTQPISLYFDDITINSENIQSLLKIITNPLVESVSINQYDSIILPQICEAVNHSTHECNLLIILKSEDKTKITDIIRKNLTTAINYSIKNDLDKSEFEKTVDENCTLKELYNDEGISGILKFIKDFEHRKFDVVKYFDTNWAKDGLMNKLNDASQEDRASFLDLFYPYSNIKTLVESLTIQDLAGAMDPEKDFSQMESLIKKKPGVLKKSCDNPDWLRIMTKKYQNYLISKKPNLKDIFTETHLTNVLQKSLYQYLHNDSNVSIHNLVEQELSSSIEQFLQNLEPKLKNIKDIEDIEDIGSLHRLIGDISAQMSKLQSLPKERKKKIATKIMEEQIKELISNELFLSSEGAIFSESYKNLIIKKLSDEIAKHNANTINISDQIRQEEAYDITDIIPESVVEYMKRFLDCFKGDQVEASELEKMVKNNYDSLCKTTIPDTVKSAVADLQSNFAQEQLDQQQQQHPDDNQINSFFHQHEMGFMGGHDQ